VLSTLLLLVVRVVELNTVEAVVQEVLELAQDYL